MGVALSTPNFVPNGQVMFAPEVCFTNVRSDLEIELVYAF
jgi:hypothetical protein